MTGNSGYGLGGVLVGEERYERGDGWEIAEGSSLIEMLSVEKGPIQTESPIVSDGAAQCSHGKGADPLMRGITTLPPGAKLAAWAQAV